MLQRISPTHDAHHVRHRLNSLTSLSAALHDSKTHLLLAASGSVATIKLPLIIRSLASHPNLSIRVLLTPAAGRFLSGQSPEQPTVSSLYSQPNVDGVYADADEWREPWKRGDAILHIELRRWADLLVIAPLSANTMAKIVGGYADGLLTSVVRAWDAWGELDSDVSSNRLADADALGQQNMDATNTHMNGDGQTNGNGNAHEASGAVQPATTNGTERRTRKKHIIVAPAMNTAMWRHPITAKQLRVLEDEWGVAKGKGKGTKTDTGADPIDGWFEVLRPQQKTLACGDVGDGAMMEWRDIVTVIEERLGLTTGDDAS